MIFNILDNTTELWMTKYIIGEIFSSDGATLYKIPSNLYRNMYELYFNVSDIFLDQLQEIRKTSMTRIICQNSNIGFMQPLAFQKENPKTNPLLSW